MAQSAPNVQSNTTAARPRRALPPWAIDSIVQGVPAAVIRESGDKAVWQLLGRVALSALNAGWTRNEWLDEVTRPRSGLGNQVRLTVKGKERNARQMYKTLDSAWDRATARHKASPAWTKANVAAEVEERAQAIRAAIQDPDNRLPDAQRLVLEYVMEQAIAKGCTVVNLPRRAVVEATGLKEKAVRIALAQLSECDWPPMPLVERGRPAGANSRVRKANAYGMPAPAALHAYLGRETRQVGPSPEAGGPLTKSQVGPSPETGGPLGLHNYDNGADMLTANAPLNLENADDLDDYIALLQAKRARMDDAPRLAAVASLDERRRVTA